MKRFLFALAVWTLAATAEAGPSGSRVFQVKNAKFDPAHASAVIEATLTADYDHQSVRMEVLRQAPPCPAGMFCAQVLPAPLLVELPITATHTDSCGIHHVTALLDDRPVDGQLKEIKFEDVQEMTCQTFAAVIAHASYRTSYYDRLNGKEVEHVSTMELELKESTPPAAPSLVLANGQLQRGFTAFEIPTDGSLEISNDSVVLNVAIGVKCPDQGPCPMLPARKISETLRVVRRTKVSCGDRIIARASDQKSILTQLDIIDYRFATCKRRFDHAVTASFQKLQRASGKITFQSGVFNFDQK